MGLGAFQYCNKDGSLDLRQNPAFKISQTIKPHLHKRRKASQPIHSPSARQSASTSNRLEARSLAATHSASSERALNTKQVYRYKYIVDPTSVAMIGGQSTTRLTIQYSYQIPTGNGSCSAALMRRRAGFRRRRFAGNGVLTHPAPQLLHPRA